MPFSALDNLLQKKQLSLVNRANYDLPFGGTTKAEFDFLSQAGAVNTMAPNFMSFMAGFQGGNLATQQSREQQYKGYGEIAELDASQRDTRAVTFNRELEGTKRGIDLLYQDEALKYKTENQRLIKENNDLINQGLERKLPYVEGGAKADMQFRQNQAYNSSVRGNVLDKDYQNYDRKFEMAQDKSNAYLDAQEAAQINHQEDRKVALRVNQVRLAYEQGDVSYDEAARQISIIRGTARVPAPAKAVTTKSGYTYMPRGGAPASPNAPVTSTTPQLPASTVGASGEYNYATPAAQATSPATQADANAVQLNIQMGRFDLYQKQGWFTPEQAADAKQLTTVLSQKGTRGLTREQVTRLMSYNDMFKQIEAGANNTPDYSNRKHDYATDTKGLGSY